ncbi:MAG: hypothetical protein II861_03995, partial [Methanomicrobium sp.]|nr:hypothetical protein [Methanomicrobium sp.]
ERFAEIIKNAVTVPRMLEYYGFDTNRHGRIACPIHQGKDQNFGYKEHFWHCFVCGAGGDVIAFVQAYFGLDFQQAIEKLNRDFHLGLPIGGEKPTLRQYREYERKAKEVIDREKQRAAEKKELDEEYKTALSVWAFLDKTRKQFEPITPDDEISEMYIYAIFHINEALYRLEQSERRLYEYEHS